MSDNDTAAPESQEPAAPSADVKSKKPNKSKLEDRLRGLQNGDLRGLVDAEKPTAPRAPFAVGTTLRYTGVDRLLQGWEGHEALAPGIQVTITETLGKCSVFRIGRTAVRALIDEDEAADWVVVG